MRKPQFNCLFVIFFMLISVFSHGQSISDWYETELIKSLKPKIDTLKEKEVLLFIAKPSFVNPEYSIRIIEKANQSFLELRIIEKNLWDELFRLRRIGASEVTLQTHFFSTAISSTFKKRMLDTFSKAIFINENKEKPSEPRTFDGTCYEFSISHCEKSSSIIINYELDRSYLEYRIANTNYQIVNDIINNLFNETKYEIYL